MMVNASIEALLNLVDLDGKDLVDLLAGAVMSSGKSRDMKRLWDLSNKLPRRRAAIDITGETGYESLLDEGLLREMTTRDGIVVIPSFKYVELHRPGDFLAIMDILDDELYRKQERILAPAPLSEMQVSILLFLVLNGNFTSKEKFIVNRDDAGPVYDSLKYILLLTAKKIQDYLGSNKRYKGDKRDTIFLADHFDNSYKGISLKTRFSLKRENNGYYLDEPGVLLDDPWVMALALEVETIGKDEFEAIAREMVRLIMDARGGMILHEMGGGRDHVNTVRVLDKLGVRIGVLDGRMVDEVEKQEKIWICKIGMGNKWHFFGSRGGKPRCDSWAWMHHERAVTPDEATRLIESNSLCRKCRSRVRSRIKELSTTG
jgi:hypothetical protein